ncbi:MAG: SAM-dependent methyltransferase [Saprospirales bacterium]|nr:MAG: SAM-dependent methyltransferase [Saprospirales bacterium]
MEHRIEKTKDGSPTVVSGIYGAEYHSGHGALAESKHVFIEAGLLHHCVKREELSILEFGFGSGLNCWLTAIEKPAEIICKYFALELHPLPAAQIAEFSQILFEAYRTSRTNQRLFQDIHLQEWGVLTEYHNNFTLIKSKQDFLQFRPEETYDLIYFDAFGPGTQPELWTRELFVHIFHALKSDGVLVTYCVQGQFRRMLTNLGFKWEKLPGPPGKREMLRAHKS